MCLCPVLVIKLVKSLYLGLYQWLVSQPSVLIVARRWSNTALHTIGILLEIILYNNLGLSLANLALRLQIFGSKWLIQAWLFPASWIFWAFPASIFWTFSASFLASSSLSKNRTSQIHEGSHREEEQGYNKQGGCEDGQSYEKPNIDLPGNRALVAHVLNNNAGPDGHGHLEDDQVAGDDLGLLLVLVPVPHCRVGDEVGQEADCKDHLPCLVRLTGLPGPVNVNVEEQNWEDDYSVEVGACGCVKDFASGFHLLGTQSFWDWANL